METSSFSKNQKIEIQFLSDIREPQSTEYIVEDILSGGMGVCLKVRNVVSGNRYGLKTIQRGFLENDRAWKTFIEEMKTWVTLSACDGVTEAYCLTRINEIPFVCAQWMSGGDLRPKIASISPLEFFTNTVRIARTLGWVHATYNVIHRDLKPENILLDESGLAFIADWGLARPIAASDSDGSFSGDKKSSGSSRPCLTQAGQIKGTILYASPEQILGSTSIDHRTDIYSFGCILYELETGLPPFVGTTSDEIAIYHLYGDVPDISRFRNRRGFGVESVIYRCLAKDPDDRFSSWDSVSDELIAIAQASQIQFDPYVPRKRYSMPRIGENELQQQIAANEVTYVKSKNQRYALMEFNGVIQFLQEASALMAIGEWQRAHDIYARFFEPEMVSESPNFELNQTITINYGNCLIQLGKADEAISVFSVIEDARLKPATYFVNLSLAYLNTHKPKEAERAARTGLALYPDDKDILGNLVLSLINQGKLDDALDLANRRIEISRDVHSLEELAIIHRSIARDRHELDLPNSVNHLQEALRLLSEAKKQNPRFPTARLSLAKTLFDLRRYTEAANELIEMLNVLGNDAFWVYEMSIVKIAECYDMKAQYQACVDFCDKWLNKFPNNIHLKRVRAQTLVDGFVIGNIQDGVPVVERSSLEFFESVVKSPNDVQDSDFCYLARLYEWMGKRNQAFELLEEAESRYPSFWEPSYDKAAILWRVDRFEEALPFVIESTEQAPWRRQPWWLLSKLYESLGREAEANQATRQVEYLDRVHAEMYSIETSN